MKRLFIYLLFYLLTIAAGQAQTPTEATHATPYETVKQEMQNRMFANSKVVYDAEDLNHIRNLYLTHAADSVTYAEVELLEATALLYAVVPDYHKVRQLLNHAERHLNDATTPADYAQWALLQGIYARRCSFEYMQAYHWLNKADSLFTAQGDTLFMAKTAQQLAILWLDLNDLEQALACNRKSEQLYAATAYPANCYYVRCNSCIIYAQQGEYDKAINQMKLDVNDALIKRDSASIFIFYHNIGQNYFLKKDLVQASDYYRKALLFLGDRQPSNTDYYALIYWSLAKLYHQEGAYDQAIEFMQKSLECARKARMLDTEVAIYHRQYTVYNALHRYREACEAMSLYELYKDSIETKMKVRDFQRIKYQADLNNLQQQMHIQQQKAEIEQSRFWLALLSVGLCAMLLCFGLYILNRRNKIRKIENERLSHQLKEEAMKNEMQKMTYDNEVSEKERQIASTMLLVSEKNKLADKFESFLKPFHDAGTLPEGMWQQFHRLIDSNEQDEHDWTQFTLHFDKVHPDFFRKLKEACADLTENELRFCSYIRIGMNSKEIAKMLSISPSSVTTTRYRIKRRLLPARKETSLDDYLRNL